MEELFHIWRRCPDVYTTRWFSEHLFTESNGALSRNSSHVWESTDFEPSVREAFETIQSTELWKTVKDAGRWKSGLRKIASSGEGAVLVDRCGDDWVVPLSWGNQIWQELEGRGWITKPGGSPRLCLFHPDMTYKLDWTLLKTSY